MIRETLKIVGIMLLPVLVTGCSSTLHKQPSSETRTRTSVVETTAERASEPADEQIRPEAFAYYVQAVLYEQMGNPYQAAIYYTKALRYCPGSYEIRFSLAGHLYKLQEYQRGLSVLAPITPEDTAVWQLRAITYSTAGAEDSARTCYLRLVALDSTQSRAYAYLAGTYRRLNDLDSMIWAYENLTRLRPHQYRLLGELGMLQAQAGRYEEARQSYQRSIEINGGQNNIAAFIGLGNLYEADRQPDSALIIFNAAVDVAPSNVIAHRCLRGLYTSLDSLDKALYHAWREVELTPLDEGASRRLGMLYYWLDSLQQSDSIFSQLAENGRPHPVNHFYLGRIAVRRDNFDRALQQFTLLTQLADSSYESWLDLGYVYREMGQHDKEIETYQTGLSHMRDDTGRSRLLMALGAARERYGQIDEALATLEELVAGHPDYDEALNYLGYMLADRGERLDYARELIARAISLEPDNAAYLDSYGWVHYRLCDYPEALVHLEKAVTLDSDPVIFDHLGDAYQAVGESEKARTWWQKALDLDPDNDQIKQKLGP